MEISQKFAEQQMLLHKTEFEKWLKIYNSFEENPKKKKLNKKEEEAIAWAKIETHFLKYRKRRTGGDKK